MRRTRIKLCGFTQADDVRGALALGVDALGFNLARGPRKIALEHAAALIALVPPPVMSVALFVDADEATIHDAMRVSRATCVQLHGDEPPELAQRLRRDWPVIRAARIANQADLLRLRGYPADALLLDAAVPGQAGGTGQAWDHGLLAGVDLGVPVLLAGGLTPTSVGPAVMATRPWGVDAASGVETTPGRKDPALMTAFVAAVSAADAGL